MIRTFYHNLQNMVMLACLLVIFMHSAGAQNQQLRKYTVQDGLASSEVYDIFQDSKGYMWFATDAGVSCFDGYRFTNYNTGNGLPDNTIFGFYEDRKGRIWFRSYNGKLSYYYSGRIINLYQLNEKIAQHIENNFPHSVYVDPLDTLWVGYRNFKLKVPLEHKTLIPLLEFRDTSAHYIIGHDEQNVTHIGSDKDSIVIELHSGRRAFNMPWNRRAMYFSSAVRIGHDARGNLLLGYRDDIVRVKATGYEVKKMPYHVIFLESDKEKNIWVGYGRGGVEMFPEGNLDAVPLHFLSDYTVTNVFQDSEGAYWFATMNNGVFYMGTRHIRNYPFYGHGRVQKFGHLDDTTLIASLFDGKIALINTSKESIRLLDSGMPYMRDMLRFRTGSMFLLGYLGIREFLWPEATFRNYEVTGYRNFVAENDSLVMMVTTYGGISRHKIKGHIIESQGTIGNFREQVYSICYDRKKQLWLGTVNGLYCYADGKIVSHKEKHPLLKSRFSCILEPSPGQLWLSSNGSGVVIYEPETGKVKQITSQIGLADNICHSLYQDMDGAIWVSTNKGISRIKPDRASGKFSFSNLDYVSGLMTNEVRCVVRSGHKLWLGTAEGISVVDLSRLQPNLAPPPVYIRSVSIFNRPVEVKNEYRLPFDSNTVTIRFTGLTYRRPGEVRYKIKMTGIDSSWKYTDQPEIQYSTMPPGEYTFMVYALNENNVLSAKPAVLRFFIEAPFWQRLWFRLGLVFSVIGLLIFILNLRHRHLQRTTRERIKSTEVELRALRAQMNPHFIFNALASIQHFILNKEIGEANKYLGKFSRLIRNVLSHSRHEMIRLSEEIQTLQLYIDLEMLRVNHKFEYVIQVDPGLNPEWVEIPSMMIQPFVENAIWHGLTRKTSEGRLTITIKPDENEDILEITVQDNGIGRKASGMVNSGKQHRSLGTALTRERLESLGKKYGTSLLFDISDLETPEGETLGTRVTLQFPLIIHES